MDRIKYGHTAVDSMLMMMTFAFQTRYFLEKTLLHLSWCTCTRTRVYCQASCRSTSASGPRSTSSARASNSYPTVRTLRTSLKITLWNHVLITRHTTKLDSLGSLHILVSLLLVGIPRFSGCRWRLVVLRGGLRGRPLFNRGRLPADNVDKSCF